MRKIQILATEMYKLINNLSPPSMNTVFKLNSHIHYNLRQISQFSRSQARSVYHGTESISYFGPKIWDILPDDYKTIGNLDTFKLKLKKGNQKIDRVGYLKFTLIG